MQGLYTGNYTILLRKVTQIKERCHVQRLNQISTDYNRIILVTLDGKILKTSRISMTITKIGQQSLRASHNGKFNTVLFWLKDINGV